jgi:hypothetical protein
MVSAFVRENEKKRNLGVFVEVSQTSQEESSRGSCRKRPTATFRPEAILAPLDQDFYELNF